MAVICHLGRAYSRAATSPHQRIASMPPGHLLGKVFQVVPMGEGPRADTGHAGELYVSQLTWECHCVSLDELEG